MGVWSTRLVVGVQITQESPAIIHRHCDCVSFELASWRGDSAGMTRPLYFRTAGGGAVSAEYLRNHRPVQPVPSKFNQL